MSYDIVEGKIKTEACEVNVVQHCNWSCRSCSHLSPMLEKRLADPDQILKDLKTLSMFYSPDHVRLLGGEPLLHPALVDVIRAVRSSGISQRIRVLTNGSLLQRTSDRFWSSVDEVHVSVYPSYNVDSSVIERSKQKAKEHGVVLKLVYFDWFREAHTQVAADGTLTERIYKTCQIAHIWRCHTVQDGFFYRCPQSLFIPEALPDSSWPSPLSDRLEINSHAEFGQELLQFLLSDRPLAACRHCLGSVGKRLPHERGPRLLATTPPAAADLVDWAYLELLEQDPHADNLCARNQDEPQKE